MTLADRFDQWAQQYEQKGMQAGMQAGIEKGDFALMLRSWKRFEETASKDDNPDISRYLGYGDLQAIWRLDAHELSFNLRPGFSSRGSAQVDWTFPIHRNLKGYLQFFTGYGETLIDYNHRQSTFGLGVSLVDWL